MFYQRTEEKGDDGWVKESGVVGGGEDKEKRGKVMVERERG